MKGRITISLVLIQFTMMCYGGIYTAGDMRLKTDSHRPNEGKVEIFYNDLWSSCYRIDDQTASVICRLLDLGIKGIPVDYYYTNEVTPRVFSSLYCSGDETNILDCRFEVFTIISNYKYTAGVICADFNSSMLRLEGSVDDVSEGRLQFLYDSVWMGLCEDRIDYVSYHLACRQMGYEMVEEFKDDGVQAIDNTDILPFNDYTCGTYFTNLDQCITTVYSYDNCSRYGRIKIKCGFAPRFTFVRLAGGNEASEGRVELYDGEWRTVCSQGFSTSAVDTVCKHAGWKTALWSGLNPGDDTLGIIPYLFYCSPNAYESFIGNCTLINRNYSCSHTHDVSVKCSDFTITDTRLVNGTGPQEGRIEIRVDDNWMTVCDTTFLHTYSENGLDTVCRSLGYRGALDMFPDAYFGEGSGGIVTHYFSCPTNALSLDNCAVRYNKNIWCKIYSSDLSVRCDDLEIEDIRLVDGTGVNEGRVEMFIDKEWRTVCGIGWSNEEADVLCRSMGFAGAEEFYNNAYFGQGTGRVFSNVFDCSGMESHIQNCTITHRGHTCSHSDDFSVSCVVTDEETRNPEIAGEPEQGDNLKEVYIPVDCKKNNIPGLLYGGVCVALLTGIAVGICISVNYRKMRKKNAANKTSTSNLPPLSNGQVPGGGPPLSHGQVPGGGASLVNSSESYRPLYIQQSATTTTNDGTVNYNSNGSVDLNPLAPPLNLSSLLKSSDSYHSV